MKLSILETLSILILFLFIGYFLQRKISFLKDYYIPVPLIGGLLFSIISLILGIRSIITFDFSALPIFTAGFFLSIGLRINKALIKKGFKLQVTFLAITAAAALAQNIISYAAGKTLGKTSAEIVITGSLGFMGDHNFAGSIPEFLISGKAYINELTALSVAALFISALAGGFIFKVLKRKTDLSENMIVPPPQFQPRELLQLVLVFTVGISLALLPSNMGAGKFINPAGGGFIAGVLMRSLFDWSKFYSVKLPQVNLLGNFCLSMLLITNFSMFDLKVLLNLTVYNFTMLLIQMLWISVLSYYVIFKIYGKNALASYTASGLVGFSIGMPASTMSTLQCISEREGAIPMVLFIVPPVGAWIINVINLYLVPLFL